VLTETRDRVVGVYETMARWHNQLGATESLDASAELFSAQNNDAVRRCRVLNPGRFATAAEAGQHRRPSSVARADLQHALVTREP
jgi:hypothetical protein